MEQPPDRWNLGWVVGWSLVYAANLIVPLMFGLEVTQEGGRGGMFQGIAVLWAGGLVVGWRSVDVRFPLLVGGSLVGLSQFYPLLQVMAGACGLSVWSALGAGPLSDPSPMAVFGGCAVTMMTGLLLIGVALSIGFPLAWLGTLTNDPSSAVTEPLTQPPCQPPVRQEGITQRPEQFFR